MVRDPLVAVDAGLVVLDRQLMGLPGARLLPVSYTHLRAHETVLDLVCRLLLEKKNNITAQTTITLSHQLPI